MRQRGVWSSWQRLLQICLLGICAFLVACGGRVELMGAIPEDEANDILAALIKVDIPAEKVPGKEGMVSILVDGDKVGRALEVLRENALPRERFAGIGQIFKKEGLISSPLEERARYIYALSQELSNTLSKIDGVLTARVHVVLPERGVAGEVGVPSSAAVFIKHQDGYNLDIIQPQIRRLVINSIPGLVGDRVSVVFVAAQPRSTHTTTPAAALGTVWGQPVAQTAVGTLSGLLWGLVVLLVLALAATGWLVWRYVLPARRQTSTAVALTPAP